MPFRTWQPWGDQMGGELVVMVHGGSGSWRHWYRNIPVLSDYYELLVPDLPSLGDAATIPKTSQPEDVGNILAEGLRSVVGPRRFHMIAFSWGCVATVLSAIQLKNQVKSILLVGPASMGKMPNKMTMQPLIPRTKAMSEQQVEKAHRENVARLMIHDRSKIDTTAVTIQAQNTSRARFNSPQFARGEYVLQGIKHTEVNLLVLYGSQDATALDNLKEREALIKAARSNALFEIREGAGHWLQYEDADWFNRRAVEWIESNIFV